MVFWREILITYREESLNSALYSPRRRVIALYLSAIACDLISQKSFRSDFHLGMPAGKRAIVPGPSQFDAVISLLSFNAFNCVRRVIYSSIVLPS